MSRGHVFLVAVVTGALVLIVATQAPAGPLPTRHGKDDAFHDVGDAADSTAGASCSCSREQALDEDCCSCTVAQVAAATSYFKERLQQLVETPLFRVYTPYPNHAGQELYDVPCSIPEFRELAVNLSEAQLGCAIQQCGCSKDHCGTEEWRLKPCFVQCGEDLSKRAKSLSELSSTKPVSSDGVGPVQYDLVENPEQFTGYGTLLDDQSAGMIWANLYSSSFCFTSCPAETDAEPSAEKRLVYRVVSGLQASVNTHIAMHYGFYVDTHEPATRQNWDFARDLQFGPWRDMFDERVGRHPERLRNMHFVFALMTRALHRLEPHVDRLLEAGAKACPKCASDHNRTREILSQLVSPPEDAPSECRALLKAFDDAALFKTRDIETLELKNEVRTRFQRMGDVMTCVGCDRCKLWGSLQFHAARVALGILLNGYDVDGRYLGEDRPFVVPQFADLMPNDIVALVNAIAQVSKSIDQARQWAQYST
jgi:hypothetical protein